MEIVCSNCDKAIIAFEILKTNEELMKDLFEPLRTNIGIKCYCGRENEAFVEGKFSVGAIDDQTYIELSESNRFYAMHFEVKRK